MRNIIFLTLGLMSGATSAYAQSVLERVLGQINGASNLAQVNGTFVNIAENIGQVATPAQTTYERGGTFYTATEYDALLAAEQANATAASAAIANSAVTFTFQDRDGLGILGAGYYFGDPVAANADPAPSGTWYDTLALAVAGAGLSSELVLVATIINPTTLTYTYQVGGSGPTFTNPTDAIASVTNQFEDNLISTFEASFSVTTAEMEVGGPLAAIDGSITNIITGVTAATAEAAAGVATAAEFTVPTINFGEMATTALGAVNTGDIMLGVNSAVDVASTSTANAVSAALTQIGGHADAGALVFNVASTASAVNGSIQNTMMAVNGSVGNVSSTALSAVNTGTITSGVNAAVQGIVAMSGQ
ncbi:MULTISPECIES: hypothetical protein [unclassified Yoonia]|uniref:hypothetical protein n=1 Tax=unclassified Yoonia TaxID=2629118 RepID=UPI002AFFCA83|nr:MULTISPECIES: hypothetical protein [unclassified Yoonia]